MKASSSVSRDIYEEPPGLLTAVFGTVHRVMTCASWRSVRLAGMALTSKVADRKTTRERKCIILRN